MKKIGRQARAASRDLARATTDEKNGALCSAAAVIRAQKSQILDANALDMEGARASQLSAAMLDRLMLDDQRVEGMAAGIEEIAAFDDPVGQTMAEWDRPNGLHIQRVRVPLGVMGIIYESRPNVTADAGALCLKSGNAVILQGRVGKLSIRVARSTRAWRRVWLTPGCRPRRSRWCRPGAAMPSV